ncbi:MAG: 5,10-methylenetetrahydrofolate reductase [Eubacteriaceae bacterium]|jgi:5,10-methylenetetrahydrofolate reductase|nr:5,10-methylenetetrahydrofolate reductase [Eubacteriaceae bacterium]
MKSKLQQSLEAGKFTITSEMAPPKGTDFSHILSIAEDIKDRVVAANVTDFQSAAVKASSLSMCIELERIGLESVLQMTGRDRNRIAIQGELLSAAHFGVKNLLALTGDHPVVGDNPQAKPVFEFDSVSILQAAVILNGGKDLAGNPLEGTPNFFLGASVTPVFDPIEVQIMKMRSKIAAGAKFFQTQGVYDVETMRELKKQTEGMDCYILAGIIPLKSPGMARYMNNNVPGIRVPEEAIERLSKAENKEEEGIRISGEYIAQLKDEGLCDGVHIMAIGAEENVPKILDVAGL